MCVNWIKKMYLLCVLSAAVVMTGCSTTKEELLPHGNASMMDMWNQGTGGSVNGLVAGSGHGGQQAMQLMDARQVLRRPLSDFDGTHTHALVLDQMSYTRHAQNEIYSQFHRLPNPDLVMYVFPHLAGTDPVPVPGYSTVFPLYQRVQYAMPGERTEDY